MFDQDETEILKLILNCGENNMIFDDNEEKSNLIKNASREQLLDLIIDVLSQCTSYHKLQTSMMLSKLDTMDLRYLFYLVEELHDPELSEERWEASRIQPDCTLNSLFAHTPPG